MFLLITKITLCYPLYPLVNKDKKNHSKFETVRPILIYFCSSVHCFAFVIIVTAFLLLLLFFTWLITYGPNHFRFSCASHNHSHSKWHHYKKMKKENTISSRKRSHCLSLWFGFVAAYTLLFFFSTFIESSVFSIFTTLTLVQDHWYTQMENNRGSNKRIDRPSSWFHSTLATNSANPISL